MTPADLLAALTAGRGGYVDPLEGLVGLPGAGGLGDLGMPPRAVIELPDPPLRPLLITLRLDLDGAKPPIWRRLEVRGDLTLDRVHGVIQSAMGWFDCHLHRFWPASGGNRWNAPYFISDMDEVNEETDAGGILEEEVRLDQVLRAPKDRLFYCYDFGDSWDHTLVVESVRPASPEDPPARCLKGRGACPPEDCGGIPGYAEIVAALAEDPDGATLDPELADWLPEDFDPTHFDIDDVNEGLAMDTEVSLTDLAEFLEAALPDIDLENAVPPAIMSVLTKLDLGEVAELAALAAPTDEDLAADPDDPGPHPSPVELADALRPFQLMLDLAADDGIPLTGAGWMRPEVVNRIATELDLIDALIGAANRENLTPSVAVLRELCQELGLLRKYKGRLVRTPAGRRAAVDTKELWAILAKAAAPEEESANGDATVLYLLHVGHGHSTGWSTWDLVTERLGRMGWTFADGTPLDRYAVHGAARTASEIVDWLGGHHRRDRDMDGPASAVQRLLARSALGLA